MSTPREPPTAPAAGCGGLSARVSSPGPEAVPPGDLGIHAIVLAAGEGRRMGEPKQLLRFGERPLLCAVVAGLADVPVDSIRVVLGYRADDVAAALGGPWKVPVHCVLNMGYRAGGMLSSIHAGLAQLPRDARAALIALGDQPLVSPQVGRCLASAFSEGRRSILVPAFDGRRGHPILVGRRHFQAIRSLPLDGGGLREYIRSRPDETWEIAVPEREVLLDVDTPRDYSEALARLNNRDPGPG